jgi:hypothetical protein
MLMEVNFGVKGTQRLSIESVHRISELQMTYLKTNILVFLEREMTLVWQH